MNSRGFKEDKSSIVKQSTQIRSKIQIAKENATEMRCMVIKEESKLMKKGKDSPHIANRYKMCDLIEAHIDECERWFKGLSFVHKKDDQLKMDLLKDADANISNPELVHFIPQDPSQTALMDIEEFDEWKLQINENETFIDQQLDQIVQGTEELKILAETMHDEFELLSTMTDNIDNQMDKTESKLQITNNQLKTLLNIASKKNNCCLDLILVVLLIISIGSIIKKFVL